MRGGAPEGTLRGRTAGKEDGMARIAILCEKPSQARDWSKALGLKGGRLSGDVDGDSVLVLPAHGFVYGYRQEDGRPAPHLMVDPSLRDRYRSWSLDGLPWDASDFDWSIHPLERPGDRSGDGERWCREDAEAIRGCDELCLGGDMDPWQEGDTGFLIEAQRVIAAGALDRRITVAEFVNQSPAAMTRAFRGRRPVGDLMADRRYTGPEFRTRFDFLTMQYARMSRVLSGSKVTPRQGRLKSAITMLVGSQLDAVAAYRKTPAYEARFRDEKGVVYTSDRQRGHRSRKDVPGGFHASAVVEDSRKARTTAPPQLPDLAALGARLAPQGVKPGELLKVYQSMYEAGLVSYPRTEDRKMVGREQYEELIGNADAIAGAVGVDPALLVHRSVRPTHMQAKGAHGPNRPGPNVPGSLDEVSRRFGRTGALVYETLARAALALLADDYHYTAVRGHVADYPDFTGGVSVPGAPGWHAVYDADVADGANDEAGGDDGSGLGSRAEPFVATVYPPRPRRPTIKWLVGRLESYSVGTGATRTSTIADVSAQGRSALLTERRGVLDLTEVGRTAYRLLPGTHIGDLHATEQVYAVMADVMAGSKGFEALDMVARWVSDDLKVMADNASRAGMRSGGAPSRPKVEAGGVRFNSTFNGHAFTDAEVARLAAGEEISFDAPSLAGGTRRVTGRLKRRSFVRDGRKVAYVAFVASTAKGYARLPDL